MQYDQEETRTQSKKRLKNDCWVCFLLPWQKISSFFMNSSSTFPLLLAKSVNISCHVFQAQTHSLIYILLGFSPDNSKSSVKFLVLYLSDPISLSKSPIKGFLFHFLWPIIVKNKHVHLLYSLNLALAAYSFNSSYYQIAKHYFFW